MGKWPIILENKALSSSIGAVCIGLKRKLLTGQEIIKKKKRAGINSSMVTRASAHSAPVLRHLGAL